MSNFEIQYLATQYGLLAVTLFFYGKLVYNDNQREKRAIESDIKRWCKYAFLSVSSAGALQRAGEKARERFPNNIKLILIAYDELLVEVPSQHRPSLYDFLINMNGCEPNKWPKAADEMAGRLKLYG